MRHLFLALCMVLVAGNAFARTQLNHHRVVKHPITPAAFSTESYLVADNSGNILSEHDSNLQRPIASISKLMVALLASEQDLDEHLNIPASRAVQSNIPRKQAQLTRRELLTMALVKSDNFAAQILCENLPDCINAMNAKATEIGMMHTYYEEPTGLSKENVSTAVDLLKLMLVASTNQTITSLSSMSHAEIQTGKNIIKIKNTNPLTAKLDIILSKTGFTNPAGGCISMMIGHNKMRRTIILLGSKNTHTRIIESLKMYNESIS